MAVNVSARQLAQPGFVDEVLTALTSAGLPASRLVLEITESVLLDDVDTVVIVLTALRERGVRIAIDDFGTGYSSLAYLAELPVDVLKVDKRFVDQVGRQDDGGSLVEAIIALSRSLRLTTVAEGVEHAEQAAWLEKAHCSTGQGFLWSRPVDLVAAAALLELGLEPDGEPPLPTVAAAPVPFRGDQLVG